MPIVVAVTPGTSKGKLLSLVGHARHGFHGPILLFGIAEELLPLFKAEPFRCEQVLYPFRIAQLLMAL